ncbi:cysteine hydrolase family protein [Chryseobacterium tongliaoense]|uniref:cysteine hydrolase family protein n=1 Tax=Chryseobacterium tongliaoense TaxID=3240933 RepID=UPI0035127585
MQDSKKTALLVMDLQNSILQNIEDTKPLLDNVSKAIAHARAKEIPVIYVIVSFRAGVPEISNRNKIFSGIGNKEMWTPEFVKQWEEIHADVKPQNNDIMVTKRRISAFAGSDLEIVLRGLNIEHLVLSGVSTSGVVLSTLREAADKDFELTVLSDCCADRDAEVHQVLKAKIFPMQAEVIDVDAWIGLV